MTPPGHLLLRLGLMGGPLDASHTADEHSADGNTPIEVEHLQSSFILEAQLRAELGLVESKALGLALGLELPLRLFDTSIRYVDLAGHPVDIALPDVHHRDETLVGVGDPLLELHGGWSIGAWTLEARVGMRVPLGETTPDPFALGDQGLRHQHFQFGTGTFDPVFALSASYAFSGAMLAWWAETRQVLYANTHGYQAGDRYATGLIAATGFGLEDVRFLFGVDVQFEAAERWHGVVPTDDGNRGRTDLLGSLGAVWSFSEASWLGLTTRIPFYTHVVGGQLEYPLLVELAIGGTIDFGGEDAEEHHDEADAHHHGGHGDLDITELGPPGSVVPLQPSDTKPLTVFDFYAPWCAPCKLLDTGLRELAAEHPDLIAIVRIDVVDDDSSAWRAYLAPGGHTLPYVRVFKPNGLVLDRSGAPEDLLEAIEALLQKELIPPAAP